MNNKVQLRVQRGVSLQLPEISLPANEQIIEQSKKEAPFCIRANASYMVEFSMLLPFFVGFMAMLLFFFPMLMVQQEVGNALLATGRELSVLSCTQTEETAGAGWMAEALFLKHLPQDSAAAQFVRGGRMGVFLHRSDFSGEQIWLKADYKMRLPFGLFGIRDFAMTQKLSCRKWTGRSEGDASEDVIVYMTKTGVVYHRKRECRYLSPHVSPADGSRIASLRNADGGKYYACPKCMEKQNAHGVTVYVTQYGNRYHGSSDCSRIKRSAFAVYLSEVTGRRCCSKCGGE